LTCKNKGGEKKMTKPGFTSITISEELKQQLTMTARAHGFRSVPALINSLLQHFLKERQTIKNAVLETMKELGPAST
jgi:hypothetical protein